MRILHATSECAPYSKTGGLGDALGALPRAQAQLGRDTGDQLAVISPAYLVDPARHGMARRLRKVEVPLGGRRYEVEVLEGRLPGGGGPVTSWLIDHEVFRRPYLYGEPTGPYPDNAFRFALLSKAALVVPRALGFHPDVLHAHDWQTGPLLHYARAELPSARRIFSIHNLAYQGLFPAAIADVVDLGWDRFNPEGYEFYGLASYIKAGLGAAQSILTVSPGYAREILTEEYGFGLDGYLRARAGRLGGVLNGVDHDAWDPARDPACAEPFSAERPGGKRTCKAALQRLLGLPPRPRVPLLGTVARLTPQKGLDLLADALDRMLPERDLQLVILASGDPEAEERWRALAARHPTRVAVRIGYDDTLARRIYAGADLFAMPSRYEPCGLGQLYALRYGAVPIVRATGGLDDTVIDYDARSHSGTGFKFLAAEASALEAALRRALAVYAADEPFAALSARAMAQDFSWAPAARAYRGYYAAARD